ncbi:hypothetical protein HDU96_002708, partial [Phlyctochytrium bullatum]
MATPEYRFLLLGHPADPQRTLFALRFAVPTDRFRGPAVFFPVLLATVRLFSGSLEVDCSQSAVDASALAASNEDFPLALRRRGVDHWPAYWDALVALSRPSSAVESLVLRVGAQYSRSQVLYFGPVAELSAAMPLLEVLPSSLSMVASWMESTPNAASTADRSRRSAQSLSTAAVQRPSSLAEASTPPRAASPVLSVRDLTPPGALVPPDSPAVTMPPRSGSFSPSEVALMRASGTWLRFGEVEVALPTPPAPSGSSASVPAPFVMPQPALRAPGVAADVPPAPSASQAPSAKFSDPPTPAAGVPGLVEPIRRRHRSAKTPGEPGATVPGVSETPVSFHTAHAFRTPAPSLHNRFAALAVADDGDDGASSSTSTSSTPSRRRRDPRPARVPSRPRPAPRTPPSPSPVVPALAPPPVGVTAAAPPRAPTSSPDASPVPRVRRCRGLPDVVGSSALPGSPPSPPGSSSSSDSSSSDPPSRPDASSRSETDSPPLAPRRGRHSRRPASTSTTLALASTPVAAAPDHRLLAANARQAAREISRITWNGNTGRDAYVWLAELRLALESRVISPSNPHGLWPSMDAAFAFCRTSSWFPANSTYRSIFQQPSLGWSSFESSCKLNLFRQFDHKNFRSELKRYTWDLPTDPVVAWSDLELRNNYLPADYRLSFARLRRIWGGGCLSGQWQLVLEDLRFPQYGRQTTYESPRVSIPEIIRALDARGVNFTASSSTSTVPAAAVSSLVSRVAALEKQATRRDRDRGTPRLNLVAFSRAGDVRDTYGRPLKPPPPSSHADLKKAYVNQ